MKELNWIKLDNAATIYPSTLSKTYATMFRETITLDEKIDVKILNKALNNIIKRFPSFRYKLKRGLFWCYFKRINGIPSIEEDYKNPMLRINFKDNNGFMFRIRYFGKRIAIEYFHAVTDGMGGLIFLLTLAGEYLKIQKKIDITYNDKVLDPKAKPTYDERADRFYKYARKYGVMDHEKFAYVIKGNLEGKNTLNIVTGIIPIDKLKILCKKYNSTITEFIVSVMILSLEDMQEVDKSRINRKRPIKIEIPINLRNMYDTKTLRNFSSFINVGIESKYGHYTLEEIIKLVRSEMCLKFDEKKINAKITANVKLAKNYFIRLMPMFIKKHIMSLFEHIMGDKYCSTVFSNLGLVVLPEEMENYVSGLGFILGKARNRSGACSCVGFKDKLYISFSRKIKESTFERIFFTKLIELGIPVEVESNYGR